MHMNTSMPIQSVFVSSFLILVFESGVCFFGGGWDGGLPQSKNSGLLGVNLLANRTKLTFSSERGVAGR